MGIQTGGTWTRLVIVAKNVQKCYRGLSSRAKNGIGNNWNMRGWRVCRMLDLQSSLLSMSLVDRLYLSWTPWLYLAMCVCTSKLRADKLGSSLSNDLDEITSTVSAQTSLIESISSGCMMLSPPKEVATAYDGIPFLWHWAKESERVVEMDLKVLHKYPKWRRGEKIKNEKVELVQVSIPESAKRPKLIKYNSWVSKRPQTLKRSCATQIQFVLTCTPRFP